MEHIKSKIEILQKCGVDVFDISSKQLDKILNAMEVYKNESIPYAPVPTCQPAGIDDSNIQSEETDSAIYQAKYEWLNGFRITAIKTIRDRFGWSLIECRNYCIKHFDKEDNI